MINGRPVKSAVGPNRRRLQLFLGCSHGAYVHVTDAKSLIIQKRSGYSILIYTRVYSKL